MIETERLTLRCFEARDLDGFAAINADEQVRRYFPSVLTREESAAQMARMQAGFEEDGFCFGAVERRADGVLLGMAGIARFEAPAPLGPCVEVGWRLAVAHWRQGYATEAARGWMRYGFDDLGIGQIVAFTAVANRASQAVMARAGMRRAEALDFDHPKLAEGHDLRRHLVWEARRGRWTGAAGLGR